MSPLVLYFQNLLSGGSAPVVVTRVSPAISQRGFRDSIRSFTPKWLQNRPGLNVGYKVLYALCAILDIMVEVTLQGLQSWLPGVGTPTALPLIGQSRGIIRGEAEADAQYSARLHAWLDTWANAGSSETMAQQIQAFLGNTPMVRIVTRSGFWVTLASNGTFSTTTAPWNWDGVSNPERAGWWSDLWIIIYPTEWAVAGTIGATADPIHDVEGVGHLVPRAAVDGILAIADQWKAAHTWIEAIVWSYDATLFDPASPVFGDPDGTWGNWALTDGSGAMNPARNASARYWVPSRG